VAAAPIRRDEVLRSVVRRSMGAGKHLGADPPTADVHRGRTPPTAADSLPKRSDELARRMDDKRACVHADLTFRDVSKRWDLRTTKQLNLIG
jgi:hypothetical protein